MITLLHFKNITSEVSAETFRDQSAGITILSNWDEVPPKKKKGKQIE